MPYTLTQEQADEVVRILGFDGQVEDYSLIGSATYPAHLYFLEDGTVLEISQDCHLEHQEMVEDPEEGLVPRDLQDVKVRGVDYGVVELIRGGKTKGYIDLMNVDTATPEERHIHDLRVLDITERAMRTGL